MQPDQLDPMIVAIIIAIVVALCVVLILSARADFFRRVPPNIYRGIGIRYEKGAVLPWRGLEPAIDTLIEMTELEMPEHANKLLQGLWIEVVPYDGLCKSPLHSNGMTRVREDDRVLWVRSNGTVRIERPPVFGMEHPVLVLRQLRENDTKAQSRTATGTGPFKEAAYSAMYHEFIEHWMSWKILGDWNGDHLRKNLIDIADRYVKHYDKVKARSGRGLVP